MSPDAPDAGDGGGSVEDPTGRFDALVQRAETLRAHGDERAAGLTGTPAPSGRRPPLLLLLVLGALIAGAVIGWVARGDDQRSPTGPPAVTSTAAPTTTTEAATTPTTVPTAPIAPPVTSPPAEGADPTPAPALEHTVVVGESFWSIAEHEVERLAGGTAAEAQVASYWRVLVQINTGNLVHPGNPDLVYPGQVIDLPVGTGP